MAFSAWFSAREFERTCVKVFALCIAAVSFVKSDAESFVAVLLHKIGSLDLLCSAIAWRFAFARLCALLAFLSFVLTFAFSRPLLSWNAGRGFCGGGGGLARSCSKLPTSERTLVISCNASSRDPPVLRRRDISRHSLRSAATNSWVVTVRSDASLGVCVAQSRILFSLCAKHRALTY